MKIKVRVQQLNDILQEIYRTISHLDFEDPRNDGTKFGRRINDSSNALNILSPLVRRFVGRFSVV